jgi:HD-GYP domain-containing protein (c-di-GMP phosphodiesterase class II)
MKSLAISSLKPNSLYSGYLYLDESYILSTPETPVTEALLKRLKTWQISEIQAEETAIDESFVPEEHKIYDEQPPDESEDGQAREETQKFYTSLLEFTHKLYDTFLKKSTISIEPLIDQVKALIAVYKKNRRFLLRLSELDRSGFSYIIGHSVNVAILAIALGDALKLPSHKMIELGMAGLLHEIGMFKLPDTFQNANRALTEPERRALTAHPILGYRILKELGLNPNVTLAVLEHHEKEDGTGYPQGLTGDKIALSAKILSIASAYDAQISLRPYRVARSGHASLMDLLKDIRKTYDDQILKRLVFALSLYPLGSFLELKNGAYAVVYDTSSTDPKHPILKVLTDEHKVPLVNAPTVQLADRPELDILRVLSADEVRRLRADKVLTV